MLMVHHGNDDWNGESPTYQSGIIGPKYSIKNATGTVNNNGQINIANGQYTGIDNTQITINKNMTINGESQTEYNNKRNRHQLDIQY